MEQCWHLADLERRATASVSTAADEDEPALPDFDGDRVARERDYKSLSLADGLAAFAARGRKPAALRVSQMREWERRGTQEGVGRIGLCDIPAMMAEHDAAHRAEIEAWDERYKKGVRGEGWGQGSFSGD